MLPPSSSAAAQEYQETLFDRQDITLSRIYPRAASNIPTDNLSHASSQFVKDVDKLAVLIPPE